MKNVKPILITLIVITIINLFWTIFFFETSPLYHFSNLPNTFTYLDNNTSMTNQHINIWAVRGQIGDILAGHFSALAFFAIAISIYFQSEANRKIQDSIDKQDISLKQQETSINHQTESNIEQAKNTLQQAEAIKLQATSIEQQNQALKIQSETLQAQIEELKESRKESSKQTEEFFINNMNIKLDRYYKILDKNLEIVNDELLKEYNRSIKVLKHDPNNTAWKSKLTIESNKIQMLILTLNFIFIEISNLKDKYPLSYNTYIEELRIRLNTNMVIYSISQSFEKADTCVAFELYDIKKTNKTEK